MDGIWPKSSHEPDGRVGSRIEVGELGSRTRRAAVRAPRYQPLSALMDSLSLSAPSYSLMSPLIEHDELGPLIEENEPLSAPSYSPRPDSDSTLICNLNSNCLDGSEHLTIDFNASPNVELANALAKMLERPDSTLKGLTICQGRNRVSEENMKCRLIVIKALSRSTKLVRLRIESVTEEDVSELCSSLTANKVLEELELEFYAFLGDCVSRISSVMAESNQSVKILRLRFFENISRKEAESLGSMLAKNSTLEELEVYVRVENPLLNIAIRHMIMPLMANDDGVSPVNTSLRRLTIDGFGLVYIGGVRDVADMLHTNKSLLYFSLRNDSLKLPILRTKSLDSMRIRRLHMEMGSLILESLKNNKTLQELHIDNCCIFKVEEFMALLVEHNFTLKTIWFQSKSYSTEDFMELVLKPYVIRGSKYISLWNWEFDGIFMEQDINPYSSGVSSGVSALEDRESPLTNAVFHHQMEPTRKSISYSSKSMPNHDIFLSYYEDEKDFAKELYINLKASNYKMLNDPNPSNNAQEELSTTSNFEAIEQSQLAIVVLSEGYITSKQSMLELSRFIKKKNTSDSNLKVIPLFYKLTLNDLDTKKVELKWAKSWKQLIEDGKVQEDEIGLWNETVKVMFDEINAELEQAKALLRDLINGMINVEEFCTQFNGACDVLDFKNYHDSEGKYLLAVVEKIKNIVPQIMKTGIDQMLGYLSMFEIQSKSSLQKMTSMLKEEPLLANQFLLQRALNKTEYWQHKYIEIYGAIEEQYDKGCIIAALFPKAFLYHFKAKLLHRALHQASNFDGKINLPMLMDVATAVANNWRILSGLDHQAFYNTTAKEISKVENISEVFLKDLDEEETFILCYHNTNNNELEFFFKDHKDMARIVGVGLKYAKAILMKGWRVKVEEILEVEWNKAWKEVKSNPRLLSKVLKLEPCVLNQKEIISEDTISPKPLVWELAKCFILRKNIEMLSIADTSVNYITTSRESDSKSQSSSGNDNNESKLEGSPLGSSTNLGVTSNRNKNQDCDNGKNKKDDEEDDKKGKSLKNLGINDVIDNDEDTTVVVDLLPGGNILEEYSPFNTRESKLSTLNRTIIPTMEFTFINRNGSKKIQSIVGDIVFSLGFNAQHGTRKKIEWIHTEMKISFGLREEEAKGKGELVRHSFKHLDVKEGKQSTKTIKTTEMTGGKEFGAKLAINGSPHGVGLSRQIEGKSTSLVGNSQQLESNYERSHDRTEGGFCITDERDPDAQEIVCTYSIPTPIDLDLAATLQKCKLQCTWVALDVGQYGSVEAFVPYTFIASRLLQKNVSGSSEEILSKERQNEEGRRNGAWYKGKKKVHNDKGTQQELPIEYIQKYEKILYLNHDMTHFNGKSHILIERERETDKSRFLSGENSRKCQYDWKNDPPLVKLPESQTSSTAGTSNDASTSSSSPSFEA